MPAAAAGGVGRIAVKVKGQDGEDVFFRVKRTSRLKRLMDAYCHHKSMSANSFVFLFDGSRLSGDQTPQELEMEEGDTIDAILPQTGG